MSTYVTKPRYVEAVHMVEKDGKFVINEDPLPKWVEDLFHDNKEEDVELFYEENQLKAYAKYADTITKLHAGDYIVKYPNGSIRIKVGFKFEADYELWNGGKK